MCKVGSTSGWAEGLCLAILFTLCLKCISPKRHDSHTLWDRCADPFWEQAKLSRQPIDWMVISSSLSSWKGPFDAVRIHLIIDVYSQRKIGINWSSRAGAHAIVASTAELMSWNPMQLSAVTSWQVNKKLEEKRKELWAPQRDTGHLNSSTHSVTYPCCRHPICLPGWLRLSTLTDERFAIAPSTEDFYVYFACCVIWSCRNMLLLYTMTKKIATFVMRILRKYHWFGGMETFRSRKSAEVSISKSSAAFINPWFFNLQDFSEALGGSAPSGVTRGHWRSPGWK